MAKKVEQPKRLHCKPEREDKCAKWSEGFATSKTGKASKVNKSKKVDDLEFEDGTVMLLDDKAEVNSIVGKVTFFAIEGASLKVNGKKVV